MATAKKLPSGAWRTQATKVINGKRVVKSFTVNPDEINGSSMKEKSTKAKALSEMQAREWQFEAKDTETYGLKVSEAMIQYIEGRTKVLSPSTITNYNRLVPLFDTIADIHVDDIKTSDIQALVNEWSIDVKSKTIRNRISFLLSALDYAECDRKFKIRYPKSVSKDIKAPDTEDVQMLIDNAPEDLKPILYLAAFGALRRGEIAALKQKDISRDICTVYVHADIVLKEKEWVYKPFPKNAQCGTVDLPKWIIDALPYSDDPESFLFDMNPGVISHKYDKLCKKLGFNYNFHSLRHYAASFRTDIGIPKKYIEETGRWKAGSAVLERVYDNPLSSSRKKYSHIVNKFIDENFKDREKQAE